ncbi:MAG: hypothetical protein FIB08_14470 [Candidatus Methanoperedens sp.]|nr:hypothetical protein [Candidatus Methanoperedens sp.]
MRFFLIIVLIAATIGTVSAADIRINNITTSNITTNNITTSNVTTNGIITNNITVSEYNITWNYTETFSGNDSIAYRINIDKEFGNNDSFINAWEVLKTDKETRKKLKGLLDAESDVKINNEAAGIDVIDVGSTLSPELFGKTHIADTIVNRYNITYRFKESIFNASSIWFLGQANTSVTIVLPEGVDVTDTAGISNVSKTISNYTVVSGFFKDMPVSRGEITLNLERNTSVRLQEINITSPQETDNQTEGNATKPLAEAMTMIRDISIFVVGAVIILLIYIFKIRRK